MQTRLRFMRFIIDTYYRQDFVKYKLVQAMQVKLGKHNLSDAEQEGLGDCFCLTLVKREGTTIEHE